MQKKLSNILFAISSYLDLLAWKVLTPNQALELEMELEDATFNGTISDPVEYTVYDVGEVPPQEEQH